MTPLLLANCHVIPCDGRPRIQNGAVLIEGTSIRAVDRRDALDPLLRDLGEVRTLDLDGRWLMPGLMDIRPPAPAPRACWPGSKRTWSCSWGIQNALDALRWRHVHPQRRRARGVDFAIKRAISSGRLRGPRIVAQGQAVVTWQPRLQPGGCISGRRDGCTATARSSKGPIIKLCIAGGIAARRRSATRKRHSPRWGRLRRRPPQEVTAHAARRPIARASSAADASSTAISWTTRPSRVKQGTYPCRPSR